MSVRFLTLSSSESDVASALEAAMFVPDVLWDSLPVFTSGNICGGKEDDDPNRINRDNLLGNDCKLANAGSLT